MVGFDANKALRSILATFTSLAVCITLLPFLYYTHELYLEKGEQLNIVVFFVVVVFSFSLFIGMCLKWVLDAKITQVYDSILCMVLGSACIQAAAFFTKGLAIIISMPAIILAIYIFYWQLEKIDKSMIKKNKKENTDNIVN